LKPEPHVEIIEIMAAYRVLEDQEAGYFTDHILTYNKMV
jgi:hypothetical protein